MRGILLLLLVARCLETIDACIWHMFVDLQFVNAGLNCLIGIQHTLGLYH